MIWSHFQVIVLAARVEAHLTASFVVRAFFIDQLVALGELTLFGERINSLPVLLLREGLTPHSFSSLRRRVELNF